MIHQQGNMQHNKMSYIVEGIDRLGKSSLIDGIQHKFGFFNTMHYQRPKLLHHYQHAPMGDEHAFEQYQYDSFTSMFNLMLGSEPFIMDRGHLGEYVYAPRYRGYSGSYVFDLEQTFINQWDRSDPRGDFIGLPPPMKLILLITSDFSFIKDDGLSFDWSRKEEEQDDFITAFECSKLPKAMIDVSNGKGSYKKPYEILDEALK